MRRSVQQPIRGHDPVLTGAAYPMVQVDLARLDVDELHSRSAGKDKPARRFGSIASIMGQCGVFPSLLRGDDFFDLAGSCIQAFPEIRTASIASVTTPEQVVDHEDVGGGIES